jgi:hypothetical protein
MDKKAFKKLTYSQTVGKIRELQELLQKYQSKDKELPKDFNYKDTILALHYLRNRLRSLKNRVK